MVACPFDAAATTSAMTIAVLRRRLFTLHSPCADQRMQRGVCGLTHPLVRVYRMPIHHNSRAIAYATTTHTNSVNNAQTPNDHERTEERPSRMPNEIQSMMASGTPNPRSCRLMNASRSRLSLSSMRMVTATHQEFGTWSAGPQELAMPPARKRFQQSIAPLAKSGTVAIRRKSPLAPCGPCRRALSFPALNRPRQS
jgi:hypothetical protein